MCYYPYNMGWQCPVCHVVNAPFVTQCPCGGQQYSFTITPVTMPYVPTWDEQTSIGGSFNDNDNRDNQN